jgi:hypothetical protein
MPMHRRRRVAVAVSCVALVAACFRDGGDPGPNPPVAVRLATVEAAPAACLARGALPDPQCTPGAIDPRVTQANLIQTICVSGHTKTVRPPAADTDALKDQQMKQYGLTLSKSQVEEDHLAPLEVGGAPRDPANLWPEPRTGTPNAGNKDKVENWMHREVCAGRLSLAEAQRRIAMDWVAEFNQGHTSDRP